MPKGAEMTDDVVAAIAAERKRQDEKWGEQNHTDEVWALILGEEFGELQKAILDGSFAVSGRYLGSRVGHKVDDTELELVQVAAVAVQWLEARARRREREATPEAQERRRTADALFNVGEDA
jgi:hypothetical protein